MAMYHDLNTQTSDFAANDVVRPLFAGGETSGATPFADEYFVDEPEIERKVPYLVLDADSSQFSALVDIAKGTNIAVEGPPGTGKSQTIVNAIAAALADGKKVLFVAEKTAALNVVRSRLEAIGLGEYIMALQAERSTRENVIQSIRDRLEIDNVVPPQHYEAQVAQFQTTRNETAQYIKTLAERFEDSELTVHDVLGKSIATSDRLSGLPKSIQLAQFPIRNGMTATTIKEIAHHGAILQAASKKASSALPYWTGIQKSALSRFDIEEIGEIATALAQSLEFIDEKVRRLDSLGLKTLDLPADLPKLVRVFEIVQSTTNTAIQKIAAKAVEADASASLRGYLDECRKLLSSHADLQRILPGEISTKTLDAVTELEEICRTHQIEDLGAEALAKKVASRRRTIEVARNLAEQFRPFAQLVAGSENWLFSDIGKLKELTSQAGREVIAHRTQALADPAALTVLKQLNQTGRELVVDQQRLCEHFTSINDVQLDHLRECHAALRKRGIFRFLSSDYRRARTLYSRITKTKGHLHEAASWLERLIEWRKREADFSGDTQAAALFGIHFRRLNTDFDFFDRLTNFYGSVWHTFPTLDHKPLRDFLLSGDAELVLGVPTLAVYPTAVRLALIDIGLDNIEAEIATQDQACRRVREIMALLGGAAKIDPSDLPALKVTTAGFLARDNMLRSESSARVILGEHFRGVETDVDELEPAATLAEAINALRTHSKAVASVIDRGVAGPAFENLSDLENSFSSSQTLQRSLNEKAGLDARSILNTGSLTERSKKLREAAHDHEGLYAHAEFARNKEALNPLLNELVGTLVVARGGHDGLGDILEALAYRSLARRAFEKHGHILSKFPGTRLDDLRTRLADLDRKIIGSSRQVLRAKIKAAARPARGTGTGKKSLWTELSLIENEASKKQRYIPVRDLTRRAGRALLELKPCWMMSPLAVAQYLERGVLSFDLCIIDEASQMTPENAVGALARSRQAVIVGDTNQLPPSNFFRKMIDDEDSDEDETVLSESILEMANATFRPGRRLRWHYRSRHSGLIRFSNRLVYNDDLVVFPSATEAIPGMGVEFRDVSGLYKAGTNPIEARAVVEAALRLMKDEPDRSLGIVTLNQKQRDLIFEEMEYALSKDPIAARYVEDWATRNDGLEQFFIKNLENVQGDERDVIFICTVYGPEEPGARVMQRFGPINGIAGKRRLNVLFSRAKQLIVTFSSMNAGDITAEAGSNEGAYMLKRWLEYCATGMLESGEILHREPDSDFEIYVIDQIKAMGCIPVPQVGVRGFSIDIGVKHPQWPHGFILGVECDGATYHSSKSARDRDRLRQEVLEGLGWRFHRIWSTDWFNDPARQAEILRRVITERLAELKAKESQFVKPKETPRQTMPIAVPPKPETKSQTTFDFALKLAPIASSPSTYRVEVGDTVRVRYLTDDKRVVQFTISPDKSDPSSGVIHYKKPIAEALLGAEEGEEVEILVGSYLRPAVLEKIVNRLN